MEKDNNNNNNNDNNDKSNINDMYEKCHNTETYICVCVREREIEREGERESWLSWCMYHSTDTILVGSCLDTDIMLTKTTSKACSIDPQQGRGRPTDP